jgi:hypothetical protein
VSASTRRSPAMASRRSRVASIGQCVAAAQCGARLAPSLHHQRAPRLLVEHRKSWRPPVRTRIPTAVAPAREKSSEIEIARRQKYAQ